MTEPTLFEAIGGLDQVRRLAHAWHERVMKDEVVSHAFSHGFHPQHTERLAAYWSEAWGGPPLYTTQYGTESFVVRMHSGNGEHEEMNRRAILCFELALEDIGVVEVKLGECLKQYFVWTNTRRMSAYPKSAEDVPRDLQLPRWTWHGLDPGCE